MVRPDELRGFSNLNVSMILTENFNMKADAKLDSTWHHRVMENLFISFSLPL